MRTILLVVAALVSPIVALALALAPGPSWLLWPVVIFALLLVVTVATQWLLRTKPPLGWLVPLSVMLISVIAVALSSPGTTGWILWPLLIAALVAIAAGLSDLDERRPKPAS